MLNRLSLSWQINFFAISYLNDTERNLKLILKQLKLNQLSFN